MSSELMRPWLQKHGKQSQSSQNGPLPPKRELPFEQESLYLTGNISKSRFKLGFRSRNAGFHVTMAAGKKNQNKNYEAERRGWVRLTINLQMFKVNVWDGRCSRNEGSSMEKYRQQETAPSVCWRRDSLCAKCAAKLLWLLLDAPNPGNKFPTVHEHYGERTKQQLQTDLFCHDSTNPQRIIPNPEHLGWMKEADWRRGEQSRRNIKVSYPTILLNIFQGFFFWETK